MKINRKEMAVVSLSIASVLLMMGVGYSKGQSPSSLPASNSYQDGTPAHMAEPVLGEKPMDMIPGEMTPPGVPEPGETPVPTPGETPIPTPPTAVPIPTP